MKSGLRKKFPRKEDTDGGEGAIAQITCQPGGGPCLITLQRAELLGGTIGSFCGGALHTPAGSSPFFVPQLVHDAASLEARRGLGSQCGVGQRGFGEYGKLCLTKTHLLKNRGDVAGLGLEIWASEKFGNLGWQAAPPP